MLGVLVAMWGSESVVALILATYTVPPSFDVQPDLRVMTFTISLATLVGLLFSVAPAWRVGRESAVAALQRSTRTATRSGRTGRTLVAVQVGLSLVLLVNGGLLVRSLQEIRAVDSGMRTDDVFVVYPGPKPGGYQGVDHDSYYPAVLQRLAGIAGVARRQRVALQTGSRRRRSSRARVPRWECSRLIARGAGRSDTGVAGVLQHAGTASAHRPAISTGAITRAADGWR